MAKKMKTSIFVLILVAAMSPLCVAQQTHGTISGLVTDESGAVIPGVSVMITNVDTGITRTVISNDSGRYSAPQLSLGNYQVEAELPGFQRAVRSGIRLTVGREAVVNLVLTVGEITALVQVTGEASLVETTSTTLSGLVEEKQIQNLPLNGRDYMQLAKNQQGVTWYRTSRSSQTTGIGARISIGGARDSQNSFLMDGTDINDLSNSTPGGAAGTSLGVETIREFQILTNAYSAEFGRNAGGVINIVTRSGTNELHGTLYYFHRNSVLDAKDFFDDPNEDIPPFKRNQFGVMIAGPIVRDKTFFMANYEGLRERLGLSRLSTVFTADAREGILPGGTVTVADSVKPYIDLYPLPNGRDFGDGRAEFFSSPNQPINEDLWVGKIDHTFSDHDSFFGRYTIDDSDRVTPDSHGLFDNNFIVRNQYVTLEEQHVFSPSFLNTLRFGFNRSRSATFATEIRPVDPSLSYIPGHLLGRLTISGLSTLGTPTLGPRDFAYNVFDFQDHGNWTVGRHSIKFGPNLKRFQDNQDSNFQFNGTYRFDSLEQWLLGDSRRVEMQLPDTDGIRGQRQWLFGVYIQDDFKATPTLSFNMGLRYEIITVPTEVNGKSSNLRNVLDPEPTIGPPFENPSLTNFGPRLGVAWDPFGDGRTSVRLGTGIFYDQLLGFAMLLPATRQPPFYLQADLANPPFPNVIDVIGDAVPRLRLNQIDYDIAGKTPSRTQYNLSIQRELMAGLLFNIGYVGSLSRHQIVLINEANTAFGEYLPDGRKFFIGDPDNPLLPGEPRRNTGFGNIGRRHLNGNGSYNSLQLGLNKRFSGNTLYQISYTYSKTLSDGDLVVAGTSDSNSSSIVDPDRRTKALAQFDIRHNVVMNAVATLPFGPGQKWGANMTGVAAALAGGWEISGIATFASGGPFSPSISDDRARQHVRSGGGGQRPDLKAGCSNSPVLGGPDLYFDPSCFVYPELGFYGNLGRSTIIGPGLANLDLAVLKVFGLGEDLNLEFRSEFFNLANRPNFGTPSGTVFNRGGSPRSSAGRISSTVTTSRQIQFGLKLIF